MYFRKMFGRKITPSCEYCQYSFKDNDDILCCNKGIDNAEGMCKRFYYDPLKREPKPTPKLPTYSAKDFEL